MSSSGSSSYPRFEYTVTSPPREGDVTSSSSENEDRREGDAEAVTTRSRIRRRVSEAPGIEVEDLVGEEERLMTIEYDDVVSREEVEDLKKNVWTPRGVYPPLESLTRHLDYRKAWEIGRSGTRLMQRSSSALKSDAGFFCDAEFDGTDCVRFLRVRRAQDDRWSVRQSMFNVLGATSDKRPVYIFPVEALLKADYRRVVGTIKINETSGIHPFVAQPTITFDLVKGQFMDAMVYCLWQIRIQMEIGKIRLQRMSNVLQLQQASTQRRRDISRARAAIARASEAPSANDITQHSNLLYDPAPQRARLSSSLIVPKIPRPRQSS